MKDVLVIGELNVDLLMNGMRSLPEVGREIIAGEMNFVLGSSSAIFAANLAFLGASTSFCGAVGDDIFGDFILRELKRKNVDSSLIIKQPGQKTGITVVLNYSQDRANVTHCGAMKTFGWKDLECVNFGEYRHLHFSSYFLQQTLRPDIPQMFRTAKEHGLSTSLDLQWDPENQWDFPYSSCLPYVDYFLPNESELLALTGCNQLVDALAIVGSAGNTIVVKRGVNGALAYHNGHYTEAAPYLHAHFVDAIGAGDSFNAGFIYSILHGKSLYESLMHGNLTGAMNTTEAGGTAAFSDLSLYKAKAKNIFSIEI